MLSCTSGDVFEEFLTGTEATEELLLSDKAKWKLLKALDSEWARPTCHLPV